MKKPEEIKKGLEVCNIWMIDEPNRCKECTYFCTKDCADTLMKNALALIQQLEATISEREKVGLDMAWELGTLKAQVPRWISAEERLPEPLQYVLVINRYDDDSFEPLVAYNRAGQWFTGSYMGGDVTHWMPLPEAPKEDAQ